MTRNPFGQPVKPGGVPAKAIFVKLVNEQKPRRIPATHAEEQHGGIGLVIYDGKEIVARFKEGVENWWTEET